MDRLENGALKPSARETAFVIPPVFGGLTDRAKRPVNGYSYFDSGDLSDSRLDLVQ
jgi:hypothetical protein